MSLGSITPSSIMRSSSLSRRRCKTLQPESRPFPPGFTPVLRPTVVLSVPTSSEASAPVFLPCSLRSPILPTKDDSSEISCSRSELRSDSPLSTRTIRRIRQSVLKLKDRRPRAAEFDEFTPIEDQSSLHPMDAPRAQTWSIRRARSMKKLIPTPSRPLYDSVSCDSFSTLIDGHSLSEQTSYSSEQMPEKDKHTVFDKFTTEPRDPPSIHEIDSNSPEPELLEELEAEAISKAECEKGHRRQRSIDLLK